MFRRSMMIKYMNTKKIRLVTNKLIASINIERFAELQKQYKSESPYPGHSKYLDMNKFMFLAVEQIYILGLNRKRNYSILDIGTGAGYFPYACEYFGHCCYSIDLSDIEMYNKITDLLGIQRTVHRVQPFKPLPNFPMKFDLITAFATVFNTFGRDGT